ncbi:MAG: glycosyltransferase, partial [Candidatus Eisenbacteria bacterium]
CPRIIEKLYNTETIVRAMPLVLEKIPEARFVFSEYMGDATYIAEMKSLVRRLGVNASVLFLRDFPYEKMPLLLNLSEVLVSIPDSDGLPISLLEGMACGVVPIVGNLPQYGGVIENEVNALVVPTKEPAALAGAIIRLLADACLRRRLSEASLSTTIDCADYETEMAKMEELYYELAGLGERKQ